MTVAAPARVAVLGQPLAEARVRELLRRRSTASRLRAALGREQQVSLDGLVYWPVALVHARAEGQGRGTWVERIQGAVDLVSGRVGLVDLQLEDPRWCTVQDAHRIPPRVPRGVAELRWHEFFRDHVDRRRKPMRPPALSIDRIQEVWLPAHLVTVGGRRYLVDALTARVDELADFPYVEGVLTERAATHPEGADACRA